MSHSDYQYKMPETKIDSAVASTNQQEDFKVGALQTEGATGQDETEWMNTKFTHWFGYYKTIPELTSVIDAKATWTVGKGFSSDSETTTILNDIKGWGKDTFNTILENMIRTYNIGGDAFCEIIRDDEEGEVINLKPLDPSTIKIVVNGKGIIKRYEQVNKINTKKVIKFQPEEMFHLARNRVADEIHGVSIVERLVPIILKKNEAMDDWQRVLHRNIDPVWIFHLDTDNETEIKEFKRKYDQMRKNGENMYVPKDVVVPELVAVAPNASLSAIPWIESLDAKFYEAAQVPKIIVGGTGGFTEQAVTITYLSFQQTIEEEQLFIEEQLLSQLGITINLEFPASIENNLLSDKEKDGEMNIDPSETTAGQTPTEEET